jgi:hypothetical protein
VAGLRQCPPECIDSVLLVRWLAKEMIILMSRISVGAIQIPAYQDHPLCNNPASPSEESGRGHLTIIVARDPDD